MSKSGWIDFTAPLPHSEKKPFKNKCLCLDFKMSPFLISRSIFSRGETCEFIFSFFPRFHLGNLSMRRRRSFQRPVFGESRERGRRRKPICFHSMRLSRFFLEEEGRGGGGKKWRTNSKTDTGWSRIGG